MRPFMSRLAISCHVGCFGFWSAAPLAAFVFLVETVSKSQSGDKAPHSKGSKQRRGAALRFNPATSSKYWLSPSQGTPPIPPPSLPPRAISGFQAERLHHHTGRLMLLTEDMAHFVLSTVSRSMRFCSPWLPGVVNSESLAASDRRTSPSRRRCRRARPCCRQSYPDDRLRGSDNATCTPRSVCTCAAVRPVACQRTMASSTSGAMPGGRSPPMSGRGAAAGRRPASCP